MFRHIVELHGGTVEAQSDGEGKGSTFIVNLPATEPAKAPAAESKKSTSHFDVPEHVACVQLQGITVLLVDDEADAREVLSNILASAGADVRSASSSADAMKSLAEITPHVLISDIAMPAEDGYEFIHRLRSMGGQISAIPAIAMTAYVRDEDREKALTAGFQLHLSKPIVPMELLLGVQRLAVKNAQNSAGGASGANVAARGGASVKNHQAASGTRRKRLVDGWRDSNKQTSDPGRPVVHGLMMQHLDA